MIWPWKLPLRVHLDLTELNASRHSLINVNQVVLFISGLHENRMNCRTCHMKTKALGGINYETDRRNDRRSNRTQPQIHISFCASDFIFYLTSSLTWGISTLKHVLFSSLSRYRKERENQNDMSVKTFASGEWYDRQNLTTRLSSEVNNDQRIFHSFAIVCV